MTYNPPFLYRCQYDDGETIERETVFGEAGMEQFYARCIQAAEGIKGASVTIEYYDRRRRKWKPVVKYQNKGGEHYAP